MNIPLNIDWQQIILHLLNFAILAGGLYFLLYHPVRKFMDQREEHYRQMENEAQQRLDQAKATQEEYRQQLKQAGDEIRQEKAQAQQTMKRAAQQRMDEADKQDQAILATAREAAARYHDKAVQDTQKELQELAVTAAEKLVLQSDGDALDQFLNAAERGSGHEHTEQ